MSVGLLNCGGPKKSSESILVSNSSKLDSLFKLYGNNLAIVSCLRCGCFIDSYNDEYIRSMKQPEGYTLLADTACNKLKFPVVYINTRDVERISDEFYNITFLKRRQSKTSYRILNVDESNRIQKIASQFFYK